MIKMMVQKNLVAKAIRESDVCQLSTTFNNVTKNTYRTLKGSCTYIRNLSLNQSQDGDSNGIIIRQDTKTKKSLITKMETGDKMTHERRFFSYFA